MPSALPDLPLRELECFVAVSESLHFGRAAERLGVSQGRVSQMIKRLESRVGASLFVRTSRTVALSEIGAELAARAVPALAELRAGFDAAQALAGSPERPLRIGFQCTVYDSVAEVVATLPAGAVQLVELPWADPFGKLQSGEIDLGLVLAPNREPGLRQLLEFSPQPQFVALAKGHPLAGKESITLRELSRVPLIRPGSAAPEYWRDAIAPLQPAAGTELHHADTAHTLAEALSMVATRQAGVLVCEASVAYMPRPDVTYVPVPELPISTLIALATDRVPQHPLAAEFITRLRVAVHSEPLREPALPRS